MPRRALITIPTWFRRIAHPSLLALVAVSAFAGCTPTEMPASSGTGGSGGGPSMAGSGTGGSGMGGTPSTVAGAAAGSTMGGSANVAGSSATAGTGGSASTAGMAGMPATAGQAPLGDSCAGGIQTGTPCDPAIDTETCVLPSLTCNCDSAGTWACQGAEMGGAGGMNAADGGTGGSSAAGGADAGGGMVTMQDKWLPSWATTIQRTEDRNEPSPLGGKTLRQFIWPSYTGSEIRLQLSNERGNGPVEISKVHMAKAMPLGQGEIDLATDVELTWGGSVSVTIPSGETAWSDPIAFELVEIAPTAITMHFTAAPSDVTGHPGSRTTSYLAEGDSVADAAVSGETYDRWYFIDAVEVKAPADAYAVAILGDSITDGYGVLNSFARWPDFLNIAVNEDPMVADQISVLNFGMGGNCLTQPGEDDDMDPGTVRFERDVLGRKDKIGWLVVLIGVNDMIYCDAQASTITAAYQDIIDRSHAEGIAVYGATITPFASHTQGEPLNIRTQVNEWITTSGSFDAVIDLSSAVADPSNPSQLNGPLSNDGLHPNEVGYEAMGNAVDLSLFYNRLGE